MEYMPYSKGDTLSVSLFKARLNFYLQLLKL